MFVNTRWLVLPLSDPGFAYWSWLNIQRQHARFRLLVVENGPGVGAWRWDADAMVQISKAGKANAMNHALAYLRDAGASVWRGFDQDDWYGPHACTAVFEALDEYDVVSSPRRWVRAENDHLYLFNPSFRSGEHHPLLRMWGGCIGGRLSFEQAQWDTEVFADAQHWLALMQLKGYRIGAISSDEAWVRWPGHPHAWRSDRQGVMLRHMCTAEEPGRDYGAVSWQDSVKIILGHPARWEPALKPGEDEWARMVPPGWEEEPCTNN